MQLFLQRLLYFWGGITLIGLIIVIFFWAIKTIVYVAFISLFISIVATAFYHFFWDKKD